MTITKISVCIDVTQPYYSKIQKLLGDENDNVNVNADIVPGATQVQIKLLLLLAHINS